jgi:hypothetical protein
MEESTAAGLIDEDDGILAISTKEPSTEAPETGKEVASTEATEEKTAGEEEKAEDPEGYVNVDRFNNIYGRYKHLERENQALRQNKQTEPAQQQTKVEGKPNPDSFETHEEFIEALTDWKIDQREVKTTQNQQHQENAQKQQQFDQRMAKGHQKYPDFEEKTYLNPEVFNSEGSKNILDALHEFEEPADLAYYLGSNPQEEQRLSGLSHIGIARELTKIEAKLSATPAKTTSKAPDPIETVGSTEILGKKLENLPQSEYDKIQNAKEFGKK